MSNIGTIIGLCIGDALGAPFEMKSSSFPKLQSWDGLFKDGGVWKGKAGQYTDDGCMTICLSNSLIRCHGFDPSNVASEYLTWYNTLNTKGIGRTATAAMKRLNDGFSYLESGLTEESAAGNGTAMRIAPLGLAYRNNIEKLLEYAVLDASITHNNLEPKMASIAVSLATALLINRATKLPNLISEILPFLTDSTVKNKLILADSLIKENIHHELALSTIGVSGYTPETVGAAFYCLIKTSSFKEAVIMAVKAGGDTDTTAAIVGALAGTYYTLNGIPSEYHSVENYQLLLELGQQLFELNC